MEKLIEVVVIDDNNVVTSSMKKYFLNNSKIAIKEIFNNGKEGLDYLLNNPNDYDFVVLDILLPQVDGIKILEELKNNKIRKIVWWSYINKKGNRRKQIIKESKVYL